MPKPKRIFIRQGITKQLVEIPPEPPKPTYAGMWREHNGVLSELFATKKSFYSWAGQRYHYKGFPSLEIVIADREMQLRNV